jgi:hypothetical protein
MDTPTLIGTACGVAVLRLLAKRHHDVVAHHTGATRVVPIVYRDSAVIVQTIEAIQHVPTAMPYLSSRLANPADHWISFDQAFLNTPICCPTRATLFTGLYSHHTGVETNGQGATLRSFESSTIATWLHGAGYHTGLIGKYINTYPFGAPFYTPPGWDRWIANFNDFYNYTNDEDGTLVAFPSPHQNLAVDTGAVIGIANRASSLGGFIAQERTSGTNISSAGDRT